MPTKPFHRVSIAVTLQNSREVSALLTPSENELIRDAQAGDVDAFAQLAHRFERRIYTLALHYTRDPFEAEDLSQEVWLKAYRALSQFRNEASFYTWLRRIMINAFLNYRRGAAIYVNDEHARLLELDAAETNEDLSGMFGGRSIHLEDEYQQKAMIEKIMSALGGLTPQQRLIFLLKHREGMTYEEISKSIGCSTGTIKKALFRAITKLREQLGIKASTLEHTHCGASPQSK
jgi:RNA polymerase sigma-70 factor (ECF subfamily)